MYVSLRVCLFLAPDTHLQRRNQVLAEGALFALALTLVFTMGRWVGKFARGGVYYVWAFLLSCYTSLGVKNGCYGTGQWNIGGWEELYVQSKASKAKQALYKNSRLSLFSTNRTHTLSLSFTILQVILTPTFNVPCNDVLSPLAIIRFPNTPARSRDSAY